MLTKQIWFDKNSQPPKNYIWAKSDGKFYEYGANGWEESKLVFPKDKQSEKPAESVSSVESTVEPIEDTSYLDLLKATKAPKYFWTYATSDKAKEILGSNTVIGGDYQSPNGSRLIVDFPKLSNLSLLHKFVKECNIGSIGFGFIWEPEDNFELVKDDIKGVHISNVGKNFEVTFEYYDSNFTFNPNGIYQTVINDVTYYEYNPSVV